MADKSGKTLKGDQSLKYDCFFPKKIKSKHINIIDECLHPFIAVCRADQFDMLNLITSDHLII